MKRIHIVAAALGTLLLGCQDPDLPTAPLRTPGLTAAVGAPRLPAPSNASARASSALQIDVSWQDNSPNETGFEVHRSTSGASGTFTLRGTTSANLTKYSDAGLNSSTEYCYKVRMVRLYDGKTGYSDFSNTACATTSALEAPSNASAVALSETEIKISWQDNSQIETGLELHRSTTGVSGTFSLLTTVGANVTAYGDAGLEPGTQYCYQVRALRVSGNNTMYSAFSNTACATSSLKAPSNASAVALSETQIDISWQDNSQIETGLELHRSTTGASGSFSLLTTVGANGTAYSDTGLEPGTQYCYRVRALQVSGSNTLYSAFSNSACRTTPAPPPPPPPNAASGASAIELSSSSVTLVWTDNSTNEDGFRIDRSTDNGVVWGLAATMGANTTSWVTDQFVCYRVVAFNVNGDAAPSNTACGAPAAPTNLTVTQVTADTLAFAWNDNSAIEDGYELREYLAWMSPCYTGETHNADDVPYDDEWTIAQLPANSTSYRVNRSLSDGPCVVRHEFSVVAKKNGHFSSAATFLVVP